MKTIMFFFGLAAALSCAAQNKYYDWDWKPSESNNARFVSQTEETDSGWVRRDFYLSTRKSQMKGLYKDSSLKIRNGWFRYFYANQFLKTEGNYVVNKKDGLWVSYYSTGARKDSGWYHKGFPLFIMAWHSNGQMSDSSVYEPDGSGQHYNWFDNGQLSHTGKSTGEQKNGEWIYYHKNGKKAAVETYDFDLPVSRVYFDENGVQQKDTVSHDRAAGFKGGSKKWKSYLMNNLDFLNGVKLVNTFFVTVVVAVTIDEDGKITDAYIDVPVSPAFDRQALKVLEKSPDWMPAINHNRRIKSFYRQPITFEQVEGW